MATWQFWTLIGTQVALLFAIYSAVERISGQLTRLDVLLVDNRTQHEELVHTLLNHPEQIAREMDRVLDDQRRAAEVRKNIRPYD